MPFSFIPCGRLVDGPQARPDPDPRSRPGRPDRLRDHLPALSATVTNCPASGSTANVLRATPATRSRRPTCRPRRRTPRSSARPAIHTLGRLEERRPQEVAFLLAKLVLEKYFRDDARQLTSPGCFPQLLDIAKPVAGRVRGLQGQHLPATAAVDRVSRTMPPSGFTRPSLPPSDGEKRLLKPILRALRHGRLDALRRFRHDPPGLQDPRRQVPYLPRRRRHGVMGAEAGPDA